MSADNQDSAAQDGDIIDSMCMSFESVDDEVDDLNSRVDTTSLPYFAMQVSILQQAC